MYAVFQGCKVTKRGAKGVHSGNKKAPINGAFSELF